MKSVSNIVSGVHHLKMASDHFESFVMDNPGTKGSTLLKSYMGKIAWISKDLTTHPKLPETVRQGVKNEWQSDAFAVPAIQEKVALLNPLQRDALEALIDKVLAGENIEMEVSEVNHQ